MNIKNNSLFTKLMFYNNVVLYLTSILFIIITILLFFKDAHILENFEQTIILEEKNKIAIYIIEIILIVILISVVITNKLLKNIITPLKEISNLSDRIATGEKIDNLKIVGQGEIRNFSISFNEMIKKLSEAQEILKFKNIELVKNIERIVAIDKLLLEINIEKDTLKTIKKLVAGFTSESGLKYSRAIYFRYSRENDYLVAEDISISNNLLDTEEKGFKFQLNNLKELVAFAKIPINEDNLLGKSFKEQKIIYKNDVGYMYNLGNEILNAVGLKNFFIFPIYGAGKYSGVIVVDNYTREIKITPEELKLLDLLSMHFSIGINNKETMITTLEAQRVTTIKELATRFLNLRGTVVDKLLKCIDSENPTEKIVEELDDIKELLERIKLDNESIKNYVEKNNEEYQKFYLGKLIDKIINDYEEKFKAENISISFFNGTRGLILGNENEIEKALKEIFDNVYTALLMKEKDRRIDIILSKKKFNKKIELKIINNGIGIPTEQLQNIYEPFVSYFPQTLGLGLFFVKKTIKEHGGVIKHFSENETGTEVKITLNGYKEEQ